MMDLRTVSVARRSLRVGRETIRMLSLVLASLVGLCAVGDPVEPTFDNEADRNGRVVFRHFL